MIDMDKVLPLIDFLAIEAAWDGSPNISYAVAKAQRDADWERVKPLLEEVARTLEFFPDLIDLGEALAQLGEEKP